MDDHLFDQTNHKLIKSGDLIIDLSSMEKGFLEMERCRQEIWDYIQYRENLLKWPSIGKGGERSRWFFRFEEKADGFKKDYLSKIP